MEYQLRTYRIEPGRLEQFVAEWRAHVVPLRRQFGFEIEGAWTVPADDVFVWILSYSGPEGFAARDREYYDSRARAAVEPNPARLIEHAETRLMWAVDGDEAEPA